MFFSEVEKTVKNLLIQHKLYNWTFEWSKSRRLFGKCSHKRNKIYISKLFVLKNSDAEVIETILHELAHAVVGPNQGHNSTWKTAATKLGAQPKAHFDKTITVVPYKYELTCTSCNFKIYKNRLSKQHKHYHKHCYNPTTKKGEFQYKIL